MSCPSIEGLVLDEESKRAIDEIRQKGRLAEYIGVMSAAGVVANILNSRQPSMVSYNIYQTDYQSFAKAMASVPTLYKRVVENIASLQELRSHNNYKQMVFWKAVREGCTP